MTIPHDAAASFQSALSRATSQDQAYGALHRLAEATVGVKLFTVMTLDMQAGLALRAYSSDPQHYPATGTKPIERNAWFDVVYGQQRCFVANSIEAIAEVFPDHRLIASLGCGSVINLPVIIAGDLVATVNLLHEAGYFTEERVAKATAGLGLPNLATLAVCNINPPD